MKFGVTLALLALGFFGSRQTVRADAFTYANGVFTTINVPGGSETVANDINNSGQIVGSFSDSNGLHGFVDTNGVFTTVNFPGAADTVATGINDTGQIVGFFRNSAGMGTAFLDSNGVFTGLNGVSATGINNSGQIVGYSNAVDSFLYANGFYTLLDVPGASNTVAWGLNNAGQIVGQYGDGTGAEHGFAKNGTNFVRIDAPGAEPGHLAYTVVSGINDSGQLVGGFTGSTGFYGFLDNAGVFTTIDFPGGKDTIASGINNSGVIVGSYTLTPEPASLLLLALGLAGIGIRIHRFQVF